MKAIDRFNETVAKLESAKNELSDADFLWNSEKYQSDMARINELESELKINWIRLQAELGMEVSIASILA